VSAPGGVVAVTDDDELVFPAASNAVTLYVYVVASTSPESLNAVEAVWP
jgi:hypothetical protein